MTGSVHGPLVSAGFDDAAPRWDRHYAAGGTMRFRPERFRSALAELCPPPADVLDFGCGSGRVAIALAQGGWRVTGCDISAEMLAVAADNSPDMQWVRLSPHTEQLPFGAETFDAVVASSVLEYVSDPLKTLTEFARILRPGGCLLATVPDLRHWKRIVEFAPAWFATVPGLWHIAKHTRFRDYANYLRLSINRYGHRRWGKVIRAADLTPARFSGCSDPLLLLVARRLGTQSTGGS